MKGEGAGYSYLSVSSHLSGAIPYGRWASEWVWRFYRGVLHPGVEMYRPNIWNIIMKNIPGIYIHVHVCVIVLYRFNRYDAMIKMHYDYMVLHHQVMKNVL